MLPRHIQDMRFAIRVTKQPHSLNKQHITMPKSLSDSNYLLFSNKLSVDIELTNNKKISKVIYPGLESHPQHELAKKQMNGFGGMITFIHKGTMSDISKFMKKLKIFTIAESLGGVDWRCESIIANS